MNNGPLRASTYAAVFALGLLVATGLPTWHVLQAASKRSAPLATLQANVSSADGAIGVSIAAITAVPSASCNGSVRHGSKRMSLKSVSSSATGGIRWSWQVAPGIAAGVWKVAVTCVVRDKIVKKAVTFTTLRSPGKAKKKGPLYVKKTLRNTPFNVSGDGPGSGSGSESGLYPVGQCTWWAALKRPDLPFFPGTSGDAKNWGASALAKGFPVDAVPTAGDIAVFAVGVANAGTSGHVAYVEQVSGNLVTISEANFSNRHPGSKRTVSAEGVMFIHRKQSKPERPPITDQPTTTTTVPTSPTTTITTVPPDPRPDPSGAPTELVIPVEKYEAGNDGFVKSDEGTYFQVVPECRATLIERGMPLRVVDYNEDIKPLIETKPRDCLGIAVSPDSQRTDFRVVATVEQRERGNAGWIERPDGSKFFVDSTCRTRLIERHGFTISVLDFDSRINLLPDVLPRDCDIIPALEGPVTTDTSVTGIIVSWDKYPDGFDGWTSRVNSTKYYTDATCRRRLIYAGMPATVLDFDSQIGPRPQIDPPPGCFDVAIPNNKGTTRTRVVTTAAMREDGGAGWVQRADGTRQPVTADCRRSLVKDRAFPITVLPQSDIDSMPPYQSDAVCGAITASR